MNQPQALVAALYLAFSIAPAVAAERPTVVELFTSEGCSSCPPADRLLAELAQRPGILALSFHVDYWDRLGWKDPFSSRAATERQQDYARLLGHGSVYTPQIVVDGRWEGVGSDQAAVAQALDRAGHGGSEVPVALALNRGQVRVVLGPGGPAEPTPAATVLLIGYDRRAVSTVERGENAGQTLTHVDVVRSLAEIGRLTGGTGEITAPVPSSAERIAVVVQAEDGRVLGAAVAAPP